MVVLSPVMNNEDRRRPVRRRTAARRLLTIIAAGLVPLAACGPSALEIYDRFEVDLVEELRSEWNATPTGGCPEVELWNIPTPLSSDFGSLFVYQGGSPELFGIDVSSASHQERVRRFTELEAAWKRSIPARQCWCIQHTVADVRYRLAVLDPGRFDGVDPAALEPQTQRRPLEQRPLMSPRTHGDWIAWATGQPGARPGLLNVIIARQRSDPDLSRRIVDAWDAGRFGGWQEAAQRPVPWEDDAFPFLSCNWLPLFGAFQ